MGLSEPRQCFTAPGEGWSCPSILFELVFPALILWGHGFACMERYHSHFAVLDCCAFCGLVSQLCSLVVSTTFPQGLLSSYWVGAVSSIRGQLTSWGQAALLLVLGHSPRGRQRAVPVPLRQHSKCTSAASGCSGRVTLWGATAAPGGRLCPKASNLQCYARTQLLALQARQGSGKANVSAGQPQLLTMFY